MLSKNKIKFINSLKKKKHRSERGLFIAEGTKLVQELLGEGAQADLLCATTGWFEKNPPDAGAKIKEQITVTEQELGKISTLRTPAQVLGVFAVPGSFSEEEDLSGKLSLVLDGINDPGNLGTIVRLADWFGIENIICSTDTVDLYNTKTVQSTMGSIARVKVAYRELTEFLGPWGRQPVFDIYGCFLEGENLYTAPLQDKGIIVMGSESHGISENLWRYINRQLYIPAFPSAKMTKAESLNVSMATGIVCSEFRRRQWISGNHSK